MGDGGDAALVPLSRTAGVGPGVGGASANTPPVVLQFGGQTAINLAGPLAALGVPILGSGQEAIDLAEDRKRFEKFLRQVGIPQPPGTAVRTLLDAEMAAEAIGYPGARAALVRARRAGDGGRAYRR